MSEALQALQIVTTLAKVAAETAQVNAQDLYKGAETIFKIGGIMFGAGVAWALLRALKENLKELKESHTTLVTLVASHDTRLALLEAGKKPRGRK